MSALTEIIYQIRNILGLANSARYTAESIKREKDRSQKKKEEKKRLEEQKKQQ